MLTRRRHATPPVAGRALRQDDRTMLLNSLPLSGCGVIDHVNERTPHDPVARRLGELGFVPGEAVRVVAFGPLGHDPMAVEIGFTRFALRRSEAERIVLRGSKENPQASGEGLSYEVAGQE